MNVQANHTKQNEHLHYA